MIQIVMILFLRHWENRYWKLNLKKFINIKGIFFDLDGTLFDTAPELTVAINLMLKDLYLKPLDVSVIKNFIGKGAENLIKKSINFSSKENSDSFFKDGDRLFKKYYTMNAADSLAYDGVEATLQNFKNENMLLACVTNKPEIYTKALLKKSGLIDFLDLVVSGDTVNKKKPDPLPLNHGCNILKLRPNEVIMVGDSCNDIDAAYAAGIFVVTVPYGYQYGKSIISNKVDLAIENLSDLKSFVN